MKNIKFIILIFCLFISPVITPFTLNAAAANKNLLPNRVYEFSNSDQRTVTYVSFAGSARYEYVARDSAGNVVDFGISTGRFAVRGGGVTAVSVIGDRQAGVSFDSSKISARESIGAALARVNINRGESVLLENSGDKAVSVNVDNTGRAEYASYDVAVRDGAGQSTFFADESRYTSLTIPEDGGAVFTAREGGLTLIYPSALSQYIKNSPSAKQALTTYPISYGRTYTIENKSAFLDRALAVSGGGQLVYDYISEDAWGYTLNYGGNVKDNRVEVTAGSVLYFTPSLPSSPAAQAAKLIYPSDWQDNISIKTGGAGALASYTAAPGGTLTVSNNGEKAVTFRADSSVPQSVLDYTYSGHLYGETEYTLDAAFAEMTVEAGYTWIFTVKQNQPLILRMPAEWLKNGVSVQGAEQDALSLGTVAPGKTLEIRNTDLFQWQSVTVLSAQPGREAVYDYVLEDALTTVYETESRQTALTLPPGGALTLTAPKTEPLNVRLPSSGAIETREIPGESIVKYELPPEKSLLLTNGADIDDYEIRLTGAPNTVVIADYLLKDKKGQAEGFGGAASGEMLSVEAGGSLLITNTDARAVTVSFPRKWQDSGLRAARSDKKALRRQVVASGQILDITNLDRRYDRDILVETPQNAQGAVKYEYCMRQARSVVIDYGIGGEGVLPLCANGSVTLMPQRGVSFTVCYPEEWHGKTVKTGVSANAPLLRRTVKPGQKLVLTNRSAFFYGVQTESGRFYIREEGDDSRVAPGEQAMSGVINLPSKAALSVIAASGADLEIVVPREWEEIFRR